MSHKHATDISYFVDHKKIKVCDKDAKQLTAVSPRQYCSIYLREKKAYSIDDSNVQYRKVGFFARAGLRGEKVAAPDDATRCVQEVRIDERRAKTIYVPVQAWHIHRTRRSVGGIFRL